MVMCVAVTGLRRGLVLLPYLQAADRTNQFPSVSPVYWGTVPVTTHPPVITAELLRHVRSTPTKPPQLQLSCAQRREGLKSLMEICQTNLQLWQQKHSTCFCWRTSQCTLCVNKKNADKKVVQKQGSDRIDAHY